MRDTLRKDTLRSVRRNGMRFLSVVIIVALGISFYIGIKSASPKMNDVINEYFNEYNLVDVRVTSRIPFSDDDINRISQLENVDCVVKSKYVDAIVRVGNTAVVDNNGMEMSCRIGQVDVESAKEFTANGKADNTYINRLQLVDGRYPQKDNECVVDARATRLYKELQIGCKINFNGDGESVTDYLKTDEFTIVGTVNSPLYISNDRGNTQVGAGTLSAFAYVDSQSFSTGDVNELLIKVTDSNEYNKFNNDYDKVVSELANQITTMSGEIIGDKMADVRIDISNNIAKKIAEIAEYNDESAEILKKKKEEIKELKLYVESEDDSLEKLKAQVQNEKDESKTNLEKVNAEFNALQLSYQKNESDLEGSSQKIDGYSEMKKLYDDLNKKHISEKKTIDSLKSTMDAEKKKLDSASANVKKTKSAVTDSEARIATLKNEIESLKNELSALEKELSELQTKINELNAKIENGNITYSEKRTLEKTYNPSATDLSNQISSKKSIISGKESELKNLNNNLPSLKSVAETARTNQSVIQNNYNSAKSNYDTAKKSYDADSATLNKYKASLDKLTEGQESLKSLQKTVSEQKTQLDRMKVTVTVAQLRYTLAVRTGDEKVLKAENEFKSANARYSNVDREYIDLENEILLKKENLQGDLDILKNTLKNVESIVWNTTSQTNLNGHKSFASSMDNIYSMSMSFPLLFLFTAMVACFVIMLKNVEDERNSIGLFKAFGYSDFTIICKYLSYSLCAWIFGMIFGILIGTCVLPRTIFSIYASAYSIPEINNVFNAKYITRGMMVSLITTAMATVFAVSRELSSTPANLMRPKAIGYSRRSIAERIPGLWERMTYGMVLFARTISRSRRRVLVCMVAILCCTALILSAFGLLNSASYVKSEQYGKNGVFRYSIQMVLNAGQTSDDSVTMDLINKDVNIEGAMLFSNTAYDVSRTSSRWKGFDNAHIIVPGETKDFSKFVSLQLIDGTTDIEEGGAVISEKMSDDLSLSVGDKIFFTDNDGNVFSSVVSGIVKNYIGHYVYMSEKTYTSTFLEEPTYKYIACTLKDYLTKVEKDYLQSEYLKTEEVTGVVESDSLASTVDISIDQVLSLVILFVAAACLLAGIVMYTISNVNISERVHEIANIKVLGFTDGEVLLYIVRENIVSSVVGTLLGLIAGIFLHKSLVDYISVGTVMYGNHIFWWSYVLAVGVIALVAVASALPIIIKINRVNMPETLKAVD